MKLDIQSLFGLHVHSSTHWLRPRNPPPRIWAPYTLALLASQDGRHLFVTPWLQLIRNYFLGALSTMLFPSISLMNLTICERLALPRLARSRKPFSRCFSSDSRLRIRVRSSRISVISLARSSLQMSSSFSSSPDALQSLFSSSEADVVPSLYCTFLGPGIEFTIIKRQGHIGGFPEGIAKGYWGRILRRNWDESLKSFPPCYSLSPLLTEYPPTPLEQKWFETGF